MINKRLLGLIQGSKQITIKNICAQWIGLVSNILLMGILSKLLSQLINNKPFMIDYRLAGIMALMIIVRYLSIRYSTMQSYTIATKVKKTLRHLILKKIERLDRSKNSQLTTADIIQLSGEGVEQLEVYFGNYLPQLIFSILAPITLFVVVAQLDIRLATILLILVFLIPISIILVMKIAKKILAKYWSKYTALGNSFLENLQGMTTLKIYEADQEKRYQMQNEAEAFRKVTMKVLMMQLNSITVMDIVTYGGYALGLAIAANSLINKEINIEQMLFIVLITLDFFTPMRRLGSFFHIAMNGIAASDKIFILLSEDEIEVKNGHIESCITQTKIIDVCFAYQSQEVLKHLTMEFNKHEFCAIVGKSGCGKSTLTKLLMNKYRIKDGAILFNDYSVNKLSEIDLNHKITLLSHQAYLFATTVKENLLMGDPMATDDELWNALQAVKMDEDLRNYEGLQTLVNQGASNFSIGQRQRIAFARALLKKSDVYIFDEVTANIDHDSEMLMMEAIKKLAQYKQVIVIAHQLSTIEHADKIYVLEQGEITEVGSHQELIINDRGYKEMWLAQQAQRQVIKRVNNED